MFSGHGSFAFPYLIFRIGLEEEHVNGAEIADESLALKLLPYPCADG
jgi:hypothetical protein